MKSTKILIILVLALGLIVCQARVSEAVEMSTAFTYQGRLIDANSTADGLYDLQFQLFDDPCVGPVIAGPVNEPALDVIDGYFTVLLDFGNVYDGDARWLEIGVRDYDPCDVNAFTTLSPRQEVTPAPYALYVNTAGYALAAGSDNDWMLVGNDDEDMYSIPSGNVGIGTMEPLQKLHVVGNVIVEGASPVWMELVSNFGTDAGINLTTSGPGVNTWEILRDGASADFLIRETIPHEPFSIDALTIKTDGNVGIGTTSPEFKLTLDNDGGIIAKGTYESGADLTVSGAGARLIWYPKKAAFRAGEVGNGQWDDPNIGDNSVAFGYNNTASGYMATVGGGEQNTASGEKATVGGGFKNTASELGATVSGGAENTASYYYATVGGGYFNTATARRATVPGGDHCTASGEYSFAAGTRAKAKHHGAFVWADSTNADFESTGDKQFLIRASGGVGIGVTNPSEVLDVNGTARLRGMRSALGTVVVADVNGVLYTQSSSRRYKTNIKELEIDKDAIFHLRPVSFQYTETGQQDIGLIAEEVEEHLQELVIYDKQGRPDAVKYDRVALYLLDVVKTQQEKIAALEERLEVLERTIQQHSSFSRPVAKEVQR